MIRLKGKKEVKKEKTTLIKPKKVKENEKNELKILTPIIMLILGIILLTDSSKAVIIIFYIIGAIFLLIGIYNLISYYKLKKELNIEDNNKLILSTSTLFIGIVILLLSGAIETFLRFIIGFVLIYSGIRNTVVALHGKNYFILIVGIGLIGIGLYTILAQNIVLQIIGALLIIASIIDFVNLLNPKNKSQQ